MILDVNNISTTEVAVFDDFFPPRLFLTFPAKLEAKLEASTCWSLMISFDKTNLIVPSILVKLLC